MIKVAVLDDWQDVARESADWSPLTARADVTFFRHAFVNEDDAAEKLRDFSIVLSMRERTPLPESLIGRLDRLQMLGITGPANATLNVTACSARGIPVCNTTGYPASLSAPAELALGLLLAVVRDIPAADAGIREGRFQEQTAAGITLAGRTLGIAGLGRLGTCMARYGHALGMKVLAWSPNLTAETAAGAGAELVAKDELFTRADAISVHLVLSPRSRHIIGTAEIGRMKPGAVLINTSRGPLIDEDALVLALGQRRIRAGLDVFDREPLPKDHPLRTVPNTVLTPHLGYVVVETMQHFYTQSIENAVAFIDGSPIRVTNQSDLRGADPDARLRSNDAAN